MTVSSSRRVEPRRFNSDNTATVCPRVWAALEEANQGLALAYGADRWTEQLDDAFSAFFARPVRVFPVSTGSAANSLALGMLAPPYSAMFAHEESHVIRDEFGGPELFSGGARLVPVSGPHGKITVETFEQALRAHTPSMPPAAVSLTEATDLGTAYRAEEIRALADLAHRNGVKVHLDGARFANALVFLGAEPADLTWRAGVDLMSFGATKNGTMGAEAVVFFDLGLINDFEQRRRRAGHLVSKSRYLAAQLLAYLDPEVWRANATRANRLARELTQRSKCRPLHPVEANELFLDVGAGGKRQIRTAGFDFDDWGSSDSGIARFVVAWDQLEEDVVALGDQLASLTDVSRIAS